MKLLLIFLILVSIVSLLFYKVVNPPLKSELLDSVQPVNNSFSVVAVGDISCNNLISSETACQQEATVRLAEKINPEFVLVLGDLQYDVATLDNFNNFYDKSWGKFKSKTKPAVGNHEYAQINAKGYYDYFNGVDQYTGSAGDRDKGYYSYQKNDWKFYVLNSNCGEAGGCGVESPQGKWLEQELTNNKSKCQIAYFHHPLFSSGLHGPVEMVKPLWQTLYKYNTDLILNGHDHLYERFSPQDPEGNIDNEKGIREFVVGTGGRNLYQVVDAMPNSEIKIANKFGVLQLDLKENEYNWQFISIDNQILDQGSAFCH